MYPQSMLLSRTKKNNVYPCKPQDYYIKVGFMGVKIIYSVTAYGSNTDGPFTVDGSNSFFSPYKILPIAQENKYLAMFFLFYHGIVCCVYSSESPHQGDSNEYTQHTIIV